MIYHLWHRWSLWVPCLFVMTLTVLFMVEAAWEGVVIFGLTSVSLTLWAWLRWDVAGCMICTRNEYERDKRAKDV